MLNLDFEGIYIYWLKVSSDLIPNIVKYPITIAQASPAPFQWEKSPKPRWVLGHGAAPWGHFEILGIQMGNYLGVVYRYGDFPFSTASLYQFRPKGIAEAVWTSEWKYSSGFGLCSEQEMSTNQVWSLMRPVSLELDDRNKVAERLYGNWKVELNLEESSIEDVVTRFHFVIAKGDRRQPLGGFVASTSLDTDMLGVCWGSIVNFSTMIIRGLEESQRMVDFVFIGKLIESKDHKRIVGNVVVQDNSKVVEGKFKATLISE
eukprot:TRINITY_DN4896_c0_g1_i3.p1 TRINITY_DN4896_c0_g1~~TRINITY_DN4896_c0_g1_i3.p1  ORF type:complete len:261 (-),score=56.02 TRINITY_DN4896_c0_g1_i3:24-806(-)